MVDLQAPTRALSLPRRSAGRANDQGSFASHRCVARRACTRPGLLTSSTSSTLRHGDKNAVGGRRARPLEPRGEASSFLALSRQEAAVGAAPREGARGRIDGADVARDGRSRTRGHRRVASPAVGAPQPSAAAARQRSAAAPAAAVRRLRGATRRRASAGESACDRYRASAGSTVAATRRRASAGDRDRASARSASSTAAAATQGNAVAARRGVAGRDAVARERDAPSARTRRTRAADTSRSYAAASATDARARSDASTGFAGCGDGDTSASRVVECADAGARGYSAASFAVGPDAGAERDAASRADAGGRGAGDGLADLSGHGPHRCGR